jgi:copper chaperone CopZ
MKIHRIAILTTVLTTVLVALVTFNRDGAAQEAIAEFIVGNMTCGSCVKNIQTALADVPGVSNVEVSVTTGRSQISFDPVRIDESEIAEKITASGYPARVSYVLSVQEHRAMQEEENKLAGKFVGRIGKRLIPKKDFQAEVAMQLKRAGGQVSEQNLIRSSWENLMQREILLTAAERSGIVVQEGEVQYEIDRMRSAMPRFNDRIAQQYGSVQSFADKIKTDMTIQRLIEEEVLTGQEDAAVRNQKLQNWYAGLATATEIRILDPQLKAAMSQGGGCGGSCCG